MTGRGSLPVVTGPLALYAAGFARALGKCGYKPLTIAAQLRLMRHASRWLAASGLEVGDLTEPQVGAFLAARRAEGYVDLLTPKAMVPLVTHLRTIGVVPAVDLQVLTGVDEFVERYREFLVAERGLAPATVTSYVHVARLFVDQRTEPGRLDFTQLTGAELIDFVVRECRGRSVGSTAYVVCGLRALLRFLHADGETAGSLGSAVPKAPSWRLTWLPRSVDPATVRRLLASCDRRTRVGRRDFAILVLLVRLGLRRGEVAALRIDDIDWRAGELVVRGKGRRRSASRFQSMWARRSPPGCGAVDRGSRRGACSPACRRRSARSRRAPCPMW